MAYVLVPEERLDLEMIGRASRHRLEVIEDLSSRGEIGSVTTGQAPLLIASREHRVGLMEANEVVWSTHCPPQVARRSTKTTRSPFFMYFAAALRPLRAA
jgi:hypothetical protein